MATAQTLQQWHDKLVRFVPSWYFQNANNKAVADGIFWGMAAVFQQCEQDMLDHQGTTFIANSAYPVLDLHGYERNVSRFTGEADPLYKNQIQNSLFLSVGENEIETVVNATLNNGPALYIENLEYGYFDDADLTETPGFLYFDDSYSIWLDGGKWYNWWTVLVPIQTAGVPATIAGNMVSAIESNKALGTTYDIVFEVTDDILEEDGINYILEEDGVTKIALEN